jgi:hypothetical protein
MGLNLHGPLEQELERIQNEEEKKENASIPSWAMKKIQDFELSPNDIVDLKQDVKMYLTKSKKATGASINLDDAWREALDGHGMMNSDSTTVDIKTKKNARITNSFNRGDRVLADGKPGKIVKVKEDTDSESLNEGVIFYQIQLDKGGVKWYDEADVEIAPNQKRKFSIGDHVTYAESPEEWVAEVTGYDDSSNKVVLKGGNKYAEKDLKKTSSPTHPWRKKNKGDDTGEKKNAVGLKKGDVVKFGQDYKMDIEDAYDDDPAELKKLMKYYGKTGTVVFASGSRVSIKVSGLPELGPVPDDMLYLVKSSPTSNSVPDKKENANLPAQTASALDEAIHEGWNAQQCINMLVKQFDVPMDVAKKAYADAKRYWEDKLSSKNSNSTTVDVKTKKENASDSYIVSTINEAAMSFTPDTADELVDLVMDHLSDTEDNGDLPGGMPSESKVKSMVKERWDRLKKKHGLGPQKNDEAHNFRVIRQGGSIGQKEWQSEPLTEVEAKETAKRMTAQLSKGEKEYYKIRYKVKKV